MVFRLAEISDLPQIKSVFKVITENMNQKNGQIWDDFYPCEFFVDDIKNKRLYVLMDNDVLVSAFALWTSEPDKYN
ncbi:MAG: GNAT family N-acetyltransferase, partial [Eubacterium sp.]|nr:GNAT family N-acetyltransferase [Eubacterium sp.]